VPLERVWAGIADPTRFTGWWAWLRELEVDGDGLVAGTVLRGRVVPPVPYPFHLDVHLERVEPGRHIAARLRRDLAGWAALWLVEVEGGCEVRVQWRLELRSPALRAGAWVARPLMVWGHDQVVASTVRRFRQVVGDTTTS
jgi:uncharacterized protein YndB with AHSA1/START domain